jgi:hypothetical protein
VIIIDDDTVKYKFICKKSVGFAFLLRRVADCIHYRNPSISCICSCTDSGTTNLKRHVDTCTGKIALGDQSIKNFSQGSTYSDGEFRFLITRWVTMCHRPFSIIEDLPLQKMLKMLYTNVKILSDTTVSRDVREAHHILKTEVAKALQVCFFDLHTPLTATNMITRSIRMTGRVHIGFDGWTSPNVISFLGVVVHYAHEGKMRSFLLDFITYTKYFSFKCQINLMVILD